MDENAPRIEGAIGIVWKRQKRTWACHWQARRDLVRAGYRPTQVRLWSGASPSVLECALIRDGSRVLQDKMLIWGRGGIAEVPSMVFQGDVRSLIATYKSDPVSGYHKLRYKTRENYDTLCRRILADHGDDELSELRYKHLLAWHQGWAVPDEKGRPRIAMAHALMGMLRTLIGFGATILEDEQCERIAGVLHRMKFKMAGHREERLTAEQANMIRAAAHAAGLHSLALAQALQFELMLRQKDVIGEWVPVSEPGMSEVISGNEKWLRGLRWEEIDDGLVLRHVTSKRDKPIEAQLTEAPMVMEELARIERGRKGPVVVSEMTEAPWKSGTFREQWRKLARSCGIPDSVKNMDTRAGAISEASDAGAPMEHIRHAATHSNISMTERYSRGAAEKSLGVMRTRAAHRNKSGK